MYHKVRPLWVLEGGRAGCSEGGKYIEGGWKRGRGERWSREGGGGEGGEIEWEGEREWEEEEEEEENEEENEEEEGEREEGRRQRP